MLKDLRRTDPAAEDVHTRIKASVSCGVAFFCFTRPRPFISHVVYQQENPIPRWESNGRGRRGHRSLTRLVCFCQAEINLVPDVKGSVFAMHQDHSLQYRRVTHLALKRTDDKLSEFWVFLRQNLP